MYFSILLALLDIGPHVMGGEPVTRTEWLRIAAPLVAAMGVLMALVCYALASRKPWSRHVIIMIFTLISIMWRALINATMFGCLSGWYFYLKPNVTRYFHQL